MSQRVIRSLPKISGTLIDTFQRKHDYLRISLTEKCSFRCRYCMPEEGVTLNPASKILTCDEIFKLSSIFVKKLGVRKIRFTGGEPLVRKDVVEIVNRVSSLKSSGLQNIGLTTNGLVLSRHLNKLKECGLDSVNISLDTLVPEKFEMITRRKGLHLVMTGIRSALEAGFQNPVKINVVAIRGFNDDEIEDFVQLTRHAPLDVRFIEYMPFDGNKWSGTKMISFRQILEVIKNKFPDLEPLEPIDIRETSKPFQVPGFSGTIGFISSMTENFCSGCNRLRITADGNLKVCLFGKEEVSLRDEIRSGRSEEEICNTIRDALSKKKKQHNGADAISKSSNRPMILIARRNFSSEVNLTHLDARGNASMVDVSQKHDSNRTAVAMGAVFLGIDVVKKIKQFENFSGKGDVVAVAKVAGIMAAKQTHNLIPMTHPLPLNQVIVDVNLESDEGRAIVTCTTKTSAKTGVEMEALTAVSVTCLTLYDMCKSSNNSIVIEKIHLVSKTGGKSDFINKAPT